MRLRLFLSFFLIVLVSMASVIFIARRNTTTAVRSFMFRGGMVDSEGLVIALEEYYRTNGSWDGALMLMLTQPHGQGWGNGNQGMGHGMGEMMNQRLRLVDAAGNLVADTSGSNMDGKVSASELEKAIPLSVNGSTVGYLLPEGGMNFTSADETRLVTRLFRAALTAGVLAGSISLLLALILAYGLQRPIRELTAAAKKMAHGDLSQRVTVRGTDELAILGTTFNQLANSLQQAEESRKAMTADIAHELRNPLAVQRANLEALQDGIYPLNPANLEPILEQNQLLTRLVEDLRTLALADSGQLELVRSPTNIIQLISSLVERFKPQAAARQVELVFTAPKSNRLTLFIDPTRLEQILGNLLSNALRYTTDGGNIHLELVSHPTYIQISVHDSGPGIPAEALPHVFERFYRADHSRSRAEGGSGLGLTIAHHLAQAQGGDLTAANHPRGGAVFTLIFPRSEEEK